MITSLSQLELSLYRYIQYSRQFPLQVRDFIPFLTNYQGNDWKKYKFTSTNSASYQKQLIPSRLSVNTYFDIFLIHWPPGFQSKIHNHAENGCCLKVLQGTLQESRYQLNSLDNSMTPLETNELPTNNVSFLSNEIGVHSISNPMTEWAVSLHVYSPQNFITTYFP